MINLSKRTLLKHGLGIIGMGLLSHLAVAKTYTFQTHYDNRHMDPMLALMNDYSATMQKFFSESGKPSWQPKLPPIQRWQDCRENYGLEIALPGAAKDDVSVTIIDGKILSIEAKMKSPLQEKCRKIVAKDGDKATKDSKKDQKDNLKLEGKPAYKKFESKRSFKFEIALPECCNVEKIDVSLENGLLTILLPKAECKKENVKKISIR